MKSIISGCAFAAALFTVGCSSGSSGGAAPAGAPTTVTGNKEGTFDITVSSVTLKQGETKDITVGITRGKNVEEDVEVKFDHLPAGVTADPASPKIGKGDKDVKVKLAAKDDAALGDHKVKASGHPGKGADATREFTVTVDKK